jgi:hypothetical protein
MRKITAILALGCFAAGCAATAPGGATTSAPTQEVRQQPTTIEVKAEPQAKRLSQAVELLGKGQVSAASRLLASVANGPRVPGVSDEALFRLALLSLRRGPEKAPARGLQLLKRLKREYPRSPWTTQAGPLIEVLGTVDELRRHNRNLATANQGLAAEREELKRKVEELDGRVKQLSGNLEELKKLDMELEQKVR